MNQEYLNVQFNKLANNLKKSLEQIDFIQKLEDVQNLEGGMTGPIGPVNLPSGPFLAGPQGTLGMPNLAPAPQIQTTNMAPAPINLGSVNVPTGPLPGLQGNLSMATLPPAPIVQATNMAPAPINPISQIAPLSAPTQQQVNLTLPTNVGPVATGPGPVQNLTGPAPSPTQVADPNENLKNVMNRLKNVSTQPGNVQRLDEGKFDEAKEELNNLRANIVAALSRIEQNMKNSDNPDQKRDLKLANEKVEELTESAKNLSNTLIGGSNELVDLEFNL